MDHLDNDFLIPVILGNGKSADSMARLIFTKASVRPYAFSVKFSFWQRLLCKCHKLMGNSDLSKLNELLHFADNNEDRGSLLLVYTEENERFIFDNASTLESRYVLAYANDTLTSGKDTNEPDEDQRYYQ